MSMVVSWSDISKTNRIAKSTTENYSEKNLIFMVIRFHKNILKSEEVMKLKKFKKNIYVYVLSKIDLQTLPNV